MDERVLFLRKKIEGENSIEEFAYRISRAVGAVVKICPCYSTSLKGMLENIKFVKLEQGRVNHIVAQTESYLLPFIRGKKIVTFHDLGTIYSSRNILYKFLKILIYIKTAEFFSDAITFVSVQTKNEFKRQIWKNKNNLHVIYNTYDERLAYNDRSALEEKPIILQIGTGKRKNLESTINAMIGLKAKLLVIGKLSDEQSRLLRENKIEYENYFDISYEEIVECYNRAKIVSFPTFYEGFGLPIVEANVMKKPVVSSDLPVIREVGGNAVFYIDPYNVATIQSAFMNLLMNSEVYKKYVSFGVDNAKRFSAEVIYPQYQELYGKL